MNRDKRLQLAYMTGESAEVIAVTMAGMHQIDITIGMVTKNADGFWSARAENGENHGDRYLDMWCAAKQLALGLGKGDFVQ